VWTSQDNPISLIAYFPLLPSSSLCFIASSHPRHFASPSFRSCRALAHHVPRFASRLVSSLSVAMSCVSRPSRPAAWSCGRRALRLLNLPAAARCPIRVQDYPHPGRFRFVSHHDFAVTPLSRPARSVRHVRHARLPSVWARRCFSVASTVIKTMFIPGCCKVNTCTCGAMQVCSDFTRQAGKRRVGPKAMNQSMKGSG
jgi:hypothetical protein